MQTTGRAQSLPQSRTLAHALAEGVPHPRDGKRGEDLQSINNLTFCPQPEIEAAQEASSQTLELCQSMRSSRFKDTFIYKLFFKTNYHTLSDRKEDILFILFYFIFINLTLSGDSRRVDSQRADVVWHSDGVLPRPKHLRAHQGVLPSPLSLPLLQVSATRLVAQCAL